jgi:hypothetical protein
VNLQVHQRVNGEGARRSRVTYAIATLFTLWIVAIIMLLILSVFTKSIEPAPRGPQANVANQLLPTRLTVQVGSWNAWEMQN